MEVKAMRPTPAAQENLARLLRWLYRKTKSMLKS